MSKHQQDILTSIITGPFAGIVGGLAKFYSQESLIGKLLNINWGFTTRLIEAGAAALICGFLGALGKHLLTLVLRKIHNRRQKH